MDITCGATSHVGRRNNNEDSWCCDPHIGLFAVADGMGGYEGGEVASRLTVDTIATLFKRLSQDDEVTLPSGLDPAMDLDENLLAIAVHAADESIRRQRSGRLASMGSTVAAVTVRGGRAVIAHVGDSRVYRLRNGRLEALTRDHSLYMDMLSAGVALPPKDEFPHANVITRALGMKGMARPDLRTEALCAGDVYLVASDGLDPVSPEGIALMLQTLSPGEAADTLVRTAFERGGKDNITAVVFAVR